MLEYQLKTNVCDFTPDNRLLVSLSDGKTLIQDDTPCIPHFWKRVGKFILNNDKNIFITCVRYQTKTINVALPAKCRYYYFMNVKSGNVGEQMMSSVRFGYANDTEIIHCIQINQFGQKQLEVPFSKGGFGLVDNFRSQES